MTKYAIAGIHCNACAKELAERLQGIQPMIRLNYNERTLEIPEQTNMDAVRRILIFEKVTIKEWEEESSNHSDSQHSHGHSHSHSHTDMSQMEDGTVKRMGIVFGINILFAVIEAVFGVLFNSMAILTDAVHDLGDAVSIGFAYYFHKFSLKEPNKRYSFGHKRFSLIGALITALILIVGSILVLINTFPRLLNPQPVNYEGMFWLAIFAIVSNGYAAWLTSKGSSANETFLNLHMLEDVLGWVGVLVVSMVVRFTDWYILDPILSMILAAFILWQAFKHLRVVGQVFLEAVPDSIDPLAFEQAILSIPHVNNLTHLHIWSIDGTEIAYTVTVGTTAETLADQEKIKEEIREWMKPYPVTHSTIEMVVDKENWITKTNKETNASMEEN